MKEKKVMYHFHGVQLGTTTNSLSPPERGRGPGRGDLNLETIDLLTPALSSIGGGEGEKLRQCQDAPLQRDFQKTACAVNNGIYDFMAIMKLKRKSLVSQGSLSRMLQAAEQAWQRRDLQQSIEIL